MSKAWSLESRITLWVSLFTISVVTVIGITSIWFALGATTREIDALVHKESNELLAIFRARALTVEAVQMRVPRTQVSPPNVRTAWRLWNPENSKVWHEFGHTTLLPPLGSKPVNRWLRWRVVEFTGYKSANDTPLLRLGVLVDGRGHLAPLKHFGTIAGSILLGAALLALASGRFFASRTAKQLARIASNIHGPSETHPPDLLSGETPPIEIQEVGEALISALNNARQEQERSGLLIAGIAHELRSPIQNLLGETEVLLMRDRTSEEYKAVLESHSEEIQELAREIDNLVTLCAQGSDQEAGSRESFDLGHEIELRLPGELARAKRREVTIDLELEGNLKMTGDREALLLVVRNLVGNAISYSPIRGTIKVSAHGGDGEIVLSVEDQGPGVLPEDRSRIFEPFQRGHERPGMRSGFGLGLALSKEAVSAQGGKLGVFDSELGGARFEARLPSKTT